MSATRSVLIVDDEPSVRMVVRAMLSAAGFTTAEAADPDTARTAVKSATQPFDLIVLDITLVGEDGTDMIPEIREAAPGSRILLVSGAGTEDDVRAADGFLRKPFNRAALLDAVNRVLGTA